jgi:hypothetical protein
MEALMKKLILMLLACVGLASCVVVPEHRVVTRESSYTYVPPATAYYTPSYTYRYYSY